jgi:predicted nuclease of predicted toxin-antitoxin system
MKFLIDVCAGKSVGEWLRTRGYDVIFVRDVDPRMDDKEILKWANDDGRILITVDKDFGYYIFYEGQLHRGVVRLPNVAREKRVELIKKVIELHNEDLKAGAVIKITLNKIKIRKA